MPAVNRTGIVIRPASDLSNNFTLTGGAASAAGAIDDAITDPSTAVDGQSIANLGGVAETAAVRLGFPGLRIGEYAPSLVAKVYGTLTAGFISIGLATGVVWEQSSEFDGGTQWYTFTYTPTSSDPWLTAEFLAANQLALTLTANPGSVISAAYVSMDAALKRPIRGLV